MTRLARLSVLLLASPFALAAAQADTWALRPPVGEEIRQKFHDWHAKFERTYKAGEEEFEHRLSIFADNLKYMEEYMKEHASVQLSANAFADLTHDEFKKHKLGYNYDPSVKLLKSAATYRYADVEAPASIDWREKGAVTPVKNQGQCGSCWAFSTTGSVEGINAISSGTLVALSEQELVDCDRPGDDHGCEGGMMDFAFKFIVKNGGIDSEDDYPYTGRDGRCDKTKETTAKVASIDGFEDVPPNDEASLKKAVAMQPVATAIEADHRAFQLYTGGVFDDASCGTELDHGVLIVGYGTDEASGKDYWLLKNSWGATWGDQGFFKLAMNGAGAEGLCGLAMVPSYPTKSGGPGPGPTPPGPTPGPTPPPNPDTVPCDATNAHTCPKGSSCCCTLNILNVCFVWGCCPYPKATCCSDHKSCCPDDHPVCDLASGTCGAQDGLSAVPMGKKTPAQFAKTWARGAQGLLSKVLPGQAAEQEAAVVETVAIVEPSVGEEQPMVEVATAVE